MQPDAPLLLPKTTPQSRSSPETDVAFRLPPACPLRAAGPAPNHTPPPYLRNRGALQCAIANRTLPLRRYPPPRASPTLERTDCGRIAQTPDAASHKFPIDCQIDSPPARPSAPA